MSNFFSHQLFTQHAQHTGAYCAWRQDQKQQGNGRQHVHSLEDAGKKHVPEARTGEMRTQKYSNTALEMALDFKALMRRCRRREGGISTCSSGSSGFPLCVRTFHTVCLLAGWNSFLPQMQAEPVNLSSKCLPTT
jgi:hypothetical protein